MFIEPGMLGDTLMGDSAGCRRRASVFMGQSIDDWRVMPKIAIPTIYLTNVT